MLRWPRWLSFRRAQPPQSQTPSTTTTPTPTPAKPTGSGSNSSPSPSRDTFEPGAPVRVNFNRLQGFTPAEREKLQRAAELVERVVNSPEFRQAVLDKTHGGERRFANAGGMSNEEIYAAILAAKENHTSAADGEIDLDLTLRNFSFFQRNVVGYTYESTPEITMNRRFFSQYTPAEIAGNMVHEWLHKLGFDHDFRSTSQRPHSVPYAVGEIVERLAAQQAA